MPLEHAAHFPHHREFEEVSDQLLEGYVRLVERGYPPAAIASAMLAATVKMHQLMANGEHLPDLLRNLADNFDLASEDFSYPFWITLTRN